MPEQRVSSSTPYPWPWDGDLTGSATALLVLVPRGYVGEQDGDRVSAVHRLAGSLRAAGGLVVLVTTRPPGRRAGDEAPGPQQDLLAGAADPDHLVHAHGIDGFCGSSLEGLLHAHGIKRLVLVGAGLETCVHSTMRSANDRGFECLLVIDATSAYELDLVPAAVSMIEMSGGIFGAVARTADVTSAFGAIQGERP